MRYTTIIDISQWPALYRNTNARLVYLHLVLRSGYHTDDRDLIATSIRRLSADLDMSESAVRCSLDALTRHGLVRRQAGGLIWVRKWVVLDYPDDKPGKTMTVTERKRQQQQQQAQQIRDDQQQHDQAERAERERERREASLRLQDTVEHSTVEELKSWLNALRAAKPSRPVRFKTAVLQNIPRHVDWLEDYIRQRDGK